MSNVAELLPGKPYNVEDKLSLLQQAQAKGSTCAIS